MFAARTEPHASFNVNSQIFSVGGAGTNTYLLMSLPLAWRLHMHTKTEFSQHYHENGQNIIVERYARKSDGAIFVLVGSIAGNKWGLQPKNRATRFIEEVPQSQKVVIKIGVGEDAQGNLSFVEDLPVLNPVKKDVSSLLTLVEQTSKIKVWKNVTGSIDSSIGGTVKSFSAVTTASNGEKTLSLQRSDLDDLLYFFMYGSFRWEMSESARCLLGMKIFQTCA